MEREKIIRLLYLMLIPAAFTGGILAGRKAFKHQRRTEILENEIDELRADVDSLDDRLSFMEDYDDSDICIHVGKDAEKLADSIIGD